MIYGRPRLLYSSAEIYVKDWAGIVTAKIGEIDQFNAKQTTSLQKSRPIGSALENASLKYGGWELTFKGGKVDWGLAKEIHAQDMILRTLGIHPLFQVQQKLEYYDGKIETFTYNDVVLYDYAIDIQSGQEIGEEFKGFSPQRNNLDLEGLGDAAYQVVQALVRKAAEEAISRAAEEYDVF